MVGVPICPMSLLPGRVTGWEGDSEGRDGEEYGEVTLENESVSAVCRSNGEGV